VDGRDQSEFGAGLESLQAGWNLERRRPAIDKGSPCVELGDRRFSSQHVRTKWSIS
jgi:hypothetical protein